MRLTQFTTNESRRAIGPMLTEARQYKLWESAGQKLMEYKLTDQQIQQIFQQVEQGMTQAGGNRTMLGQGKDAVSAVNQAWEQLKGEIQNSKPIKGVDALYDQAAEKLKSATGGDEGLMKYVNKYRTFAKKHPIAQSFIYAALAAAVGLTTAGLGAPAALGLLRMTDKLLQGEKFSSAAYSGGKTAAMSMLAKFFKKPDAELPTETPPVKLPDGTEYTVQPGDTLSQIAEKNGVSVKDIMNANAGQTTPAGEVVTWNDPNALTDVNPMGDAIPSGTGVEQTYNVAPKLTNPDVLKVGQKINIPGSLGPTQTYADGVGTAADTWDKVKDGTYSASEISRNQAAKWGLDGAGKYNPPAGSVTDTATDAAMSAPIPADQAPMYQADADQYDDGASQLGQNADMTKVADTNQGRLKMNQWRQETGSPNAKPDVPTDSAPAPDASSVVQGGSPSLSLSDTGNGIKGDLTLPDGSTVPAQAFPADGMQPRMPFGSQKVTVDLNGQKVDAWVYNGKAYIKDFDTNTLKAPAPQMPASTGSPFFDRMNRAAANGVKLRESRADSSNLTESQIKRIFILSSRVMMNEGMWDSIKSATGKAVDWAQTKGHNLTTKVTADKLNSAWEKVNKPTDGEAIAKLLSQFGIPQPVIDASMKAVGGTQAPVEPAQQAEPDGRIEPTMDKAQPKSTVPSVNTRTPTNMATGVAKSAAPAPAAPQGTSYEIGSKKAAPAAPQPQGFASRGIAGMDAAPSAPASQEQPGFLSSFGTVGRNAAQRQGRKEFAEEVSRLEQYLEEVSNKLLGNYKAKASIDASAADKRGDFERGNKRFRGIVKATNKQFDNDAKARKEKEDGVTEEMIAKNLRNELNLFKRGQKADKELTSKPKDKEIQKKKVNENRVDSPVSQALIRRIVNQRTDLLAKFGPQAVMSAVDEVADWVGDVDEIGSSDVSAWISQVERYLRTGAGEGINEVSDDKLKRYMRGVSDDSQKHPKDPTKRKPAKASRSVTGFAKASNRLQKREEELEEDCWDGYEQIGMKNKGGKKVPNCVPKNKK
jgi:LysM repeat protein